MTEVLAAAAGVEEDTQSQASVLMDMRPSLDGYYGIPQETRLLFNTLSHMACFRLEGLLQMSIRRVRGGVAEGAVMRTAQRLHRFSKTIVSLKSAVHADWTDALGSWLGDQIHRWRLRLAAWSGLTPLPLLRFETRFFQDFVWQQLFARTLPPSERAHVLRHDYRVCSSPWRVMHLCGIERARLSGSSRYPRVDTRGVDVFVAQTPYPGRVAAGTTLVVHYHDAIPVLMPHTISDRAFHEASHFHALAANVRDGAYFVCVSEATRQDLLRLFPEAAERAVTIHNMLPDHYRPTEAQPGRIPGIVRRHQHGEFSPKTGKKTWMLSRRFGSEEEKTSFYATTFAPGTRFLLMVSTLEPRKNHLRLLEAWQALRDSVDPELKLVIVGHIGWDYQDTLNACLQGIEQGGLFMLHSVPAEDLRILYRQATLTVCPSVGEGFDFAGVEAMRCGGVVAASAIDVHHEVYGDATAYFDPYDTASLVSTVHDLIYADGAEARREQLRARGAAQSTLYVPERIAPQWREFLLRVAARPTRRMRHADDASPTPP